MNIPFTKLLSMVVYFVFIIFIGLIFSKQKHTIKSFFIGNRTLGPWVAALSLGASDLSSWLLMGLPGVIYLSGISTTFWLIFCSTICIYLNWKIVAPRLRNYSQIANDSITLPDYLSNRFHDEKKILMLFSAVFIAIFFTLYVSTGFVACGKILSAVLNVDYIYAMLISAFIIVTYTAIGGFLADSIIEFFQALFIIGSLIIVLIFSLRMIGTVDIFGEVEQYEGFLNIFKTYDNETNSSDGLGIVGILSSFGWGLGYFGMPHLLIRFMAIKSSVEIKKSRIISMVWYVIILESVHTIDKRAKM